MNTTNPCSQEYSVSLMSNHIFISSLSLSAFAQSRRLIHNACLLFGYDQTLFLLLSLLLFLLLLLLFLGKTFFAHFFTVCSYIWEALSFFIIYVTFVYSAWPSTRMKILCVTLSWAVFTWYDYFISQLLRHRDLKSFSVRLGIETFFTILI